MIRARWGRDRLQPGIGGTAMARQYWFGLGGAACLAALLLAPAAAQQGPLILPPGGGSPSPASPEAARAAETAQEILLLRLLAQHKPPRETLKEIRNLVAASLTQLDA